MKTYTFEEVFTEIPDDQNNVLVNFPPEIIDSVKWKEGDTIVVSVENNTMVFRKKEGDTIVVSEENDAIVFRKQE